MLVFSVTNVMTVVTVLTLNTVPTGITVHAVIFNPTYSLEFLNCYDFPLFKSPPASYKACLSVSYVSYPHCFGVQHV